MHQLWQNQNLRCLLPINFNFDGAEFNITGYELRGDSTSRPKFSMKSSKAVVCDQVYVLYNGANETKWISMHPFVVAEPAIAPNTWKIIILDSVGDNKDGMITGEEPIYYVDILSLIHI